MTYFIKIKIILKFLNSILLFRGLSKQLRDEHSFIFQQVLVSVSKQAEFLYRIILFPDNFLPPASNIPVCATIAPTNRAATYLPRPILR